MRSNSNKNNFDNINTDKYFYNLLERRNKHIFVDL